MVGTILGVLFILLLLFFVGQAFWKPLGLFFKIGLRLILGGLFLFLVNFIPNFFLGVNLVSALTVGVLGLPGFLLLFALKAVVGYW
ncbi:MAG: pro-sigmaK processing inhibitor BofA family protein [Syntrophaceticus sp.]|nr:pro-sigmaK processing inhibitor BofA family protein [Syntrophaceticus sp.]